MVSEAFSHRLKPLQEKLQEYIDNGTTLGWLIDRQHRQVHIYRPNQGPQILENLVQVSGAPELPGFCSPVGKIG
jgi:Uma2 family endonuclease